MKRIVPAVLLLLIAFTLVCSSTYAWFSMNTQVSAANIQIRVVAAGNLLISESENDAYLKDIEFDASVLEMVPCSTQPSANPTFYKRLHAGSEMKVDDAAYDAETTFEKAVENEDYLKKTMYLITTGTEDAKNLRAKLVIKNGGQEEFDSSLRVLLVFTNTATSETGKYVYAPVGNPTAVKGIAGISAGGRPTLGTTVDFRTNGSVIMETMTKATPIKVDAYIWYEGQDPSCMAVNIVNPDETEFMFEFEVDDYHS